MKLKLQDIWIWFTICREDKYIYIHVHIYTCVLAFEEGHFRKKIEKQWPKFFFTCTEWIFEKSCLLMLGCNGNMPHQGQHVQYHASHQTTTDIHFLGESLRKVCQGEPQTSTLLHSIFLPAPFLKSSNVTEMFSPVCSTSRPSAADFIWILVLCHQRLAVTFAWGIKHLNFPNLKKWGCEHLYFR